MAHPVAKRIKGLSELLSLGLSNLLSFNFAFSNEYFQRKLVNAICKGLNLQSLPP